MTKLLERAIARAKRLSADDQNEAAAILFSIASRQKAPIPLDAETRAAIREGLAQARRGQFVSDKSMNAFFKRHGV
jgi:predicted transcriptional regulator